MAKAEFILPAMGEGIIEATITRWFVKEGDVVQEDDPLLEVATDKVDSEVPSPFTGKILKIVYHEGDIPKIGEVIALIESDSAEENDEPVAEPTIAENKPESTKAAPAVKTAKRKTSEINANEVNKPNPALTPFVRFLARNRGISGMEMQQLKGSGANGRITKDDINSYLLAGRPFRNGNGHTLVHDEAAEKPPESALSEQPKYIPEPDEELIEMSRTRRLIAEHMVRSKRISPHVTSMVELDVTNVVQWRSKNKDQFFQKHNVKLTYTPLIVEAAAKALKDYPGINISVQGNYIVQKKKINIGVATALPDGNLIVPVIKEADKRNFINIATELSDLANRARSNQLQPHEIKGGTFTITNMGQYDNVSGTPIINQPEVAILAVGAIKKKPAVVTVNGEQTIGIRDILILSLTYDHRVVDGALGGSFVRKIGEYLTSDFPNF